MKKRFEVKQVENENVERKQGLVFFATIPFKFFTSSFHSKLFGVTDPFGKTLLATDVLLTRIFQIEDLVRSKLGKVLDQVCVASVFVLSELINMTKYSWN